MGTRPSWQPLADASFAEAGETYKDGEIPSTTDKHDALHLILLWVDGVGFKVLNHVLVGIQQCTLDDGSL